VNGGERPSRQVRNRRTRFLQTETIFPIRTPLGTPIQITRQSFTGRRGNPRVSFLAGLHGDELEGVYLCHRLIQYLRGLQAREPEALRGTVHIYPAVNPQALGAATRLSPFFASDMNRQLGDKNGHSLPAQACQKLLDSLRNSSDCVVDLHASNLHLRELAQIRIIEEFDRKLIPLALRTNTDLIWVHPASGVFESTFGYNLNRAKIPTLVVEAGICLRIDDALCDQVLNGMIHLLHHLGVLATAEGAPEVKEPMLVHPSEVHQVQAEHAGLFVARARLGQMLEAGDILGEVVDPLRGEVVEEAVAPEAGLLFTLREHPVTYQGAALARIAQPSRGRP